LTGALGSFGSDAHVHETIPFDMGGRSVLDVGCGNGKDLMQPAFAVAAERWGLDPDPRAVELGRRMFPALSLVQGTAEKLPFKAARFDVVMSRVALPYTNIPIALAEIARVMKPQGYLCLLLHDWKMQAEFAGKAWQERAWKRLIDLGYVTAASVCYAFLNCIPAKPWDGSRETFQFQWVMRRRLARLGFEAICYERTSRHFFITARYRPAA